MSGETRMALRDRDGVWHQPLGPKDPDAWFQPIKCGGGISLPGHPEKVPLADICADCRTGRVADGYERVPIPTTPIPDQHDHQED